MMSEDVSGVVTVRYLAAVMLMPTDDCLTPTVRFESCVIMITLINKIKFTFTIGRTG
jgi:hypothetical protein